MAVLSELESHLEKLQQQLEGAYQTFGEECFSISWWDNETNDSEESSDWELKRWRKVKGEHCGRIKELIDEIDSLKTAIKSKKIEQRRAAIILNAKNPIRKKISFLKDEYVFVLERMDPNDYFIMMTSDKKADAFHMCKIDEDEVCDYWEPRSYAVVSVLARYYLDDILQAISANEGGELTSDLYTPNKVHY